MPGKCTFNNEWFSKPHYSQWLAKCVDPSKAKCTLCAKSFDISNMGEAGLKSHMKSSKHQKLVSSSSDASTRPIALYLTPSTSSKRQDVPTTSTVSPSKSVPSTSTTANISSHFTTDTVLKSEVLWTLKVVESHYSFHSAENSSDLFALMFPDSEIASRFKCGENKTAYLSTYGLGPYFKSLLKEKVKMAGSYVLLFDESLNKHLQKQQLDVHARFWDEGLVKTRYVCSEFLGHATADNLHERMLPIIQEFGISNLAQISMDGPNVNWKVFDQLCKDVKKQQIGKKLLNLGSCGMHVMHNAFRCGCQACGWNLEESLQSMHSLFKDSPARSEDYISITGSSKFPSLFCKHRWLENVCVMQRALEVMPQLKKYIEATKQKKVTKPTSKTYDTVCEAVADPLFPTKGEFFISVAGDLEPFLAKYQTDAPMMAFLASDLYSVLKSLMQCFVKQTVLADVTTALRMSKISVEDKKNLKELSNVDVGFVAKNLLSQLKKRGAISDREVLKFKQECQTFLSSVCKKLLEKSPIKYPIVRTSSWLNPECVASQPVNSKSTLTTCLQLLVDAGYVHARDCDRVLREFQALVDNSSSEGSPTPFAAFSRETDRLDTFYYKLEGQTSYSRLWAVVKMMLSLSHGQADVERGFSVNKELTVENQKENSLNARRLISDHLKNVGGVCKVNISKELLSYARNARQRYRQHLEEEAAKKQETKRGEKRKELQREVEQYKKRKAQMESDIKELQREADEKAEAAEHTCDLTLVTNSNALRRHAKEKSEALMDIEKHIALKLKEMQQ
ncbi:hypothetical protein HOLleu_27914 [Holothuria leucospilota]|uniref:Uncharacterized protein n=1 Tax=Holothuria leucospilota TaxID=206669 RepID=A0A9Q1H345_HOLLE|nr:hypothetical protein HOLleu_27914 [Holothuria leucospilota]